MKMWLEYDRTFVASLWWWIPAVYIIHTSLWGSHPAKHVGVTWVCFLKASLLRLMLTTFSRSDSLALYPAHQRAVIVLRGGSELQCNKTLGVISPWSFQPAPKRPTLAETASEHWLSDVPVFSKNKRTHAHLHPYTHALWHACMHTSTLTSSIIYTQVYLHANGPFRDNLITQRRLRPVCSFARWEYRRGGMETSFCRG